MESHLTEEASWAAGLAARLRLVQADCADQPLAQREGFIAEEVERALKEVPPSKRRAYIEALADRFPVWQVAGLAEDEVQPRAELVEDTPERRLESLLKVLPDLSPEQRQQFAEQLQRAGLVLTVGKTELTASEELQQAIGLEARQTLDAGRLFKVLAALLKFVLQHEQMLANTWRELSPPPDVIRISPGKLKKNTARYVAGDGEVSNQQIEQSLDEMRKLSASLVLAIGGVGQSFASRYLERFAPEAIRGLAEMEKRSWDLVSVDALSWRKFVQLSKEFATERAIEKEIRDAMVRFAIKVIGGRNTDPAT